MSLSSTAFALQTLAEKNQLTTRHGRAAFSVLLLQDLAVIPLLALVPLLAPDARGPLQSAGAVAALGTIGILIATAVAGRYVLRYALRIVAGIRVQEVFTALALLTVVSAALLMDRLGLSAALGAFLAGVLLADSEYRHALQADLEPFKGLLLGLFFIAVGMSLDLRALAAEPLTILAMVAGLIAVKGVILFALGRANGLSVPSARALAVAIAQGGEFAFVVLGVAADAALVDRPMADRLIVVVGAVAGGDAVAVRRQRLAGAARGRAQGAGQRVRPAAGRRRTGDHRRLRALRADRRPHPAAPDISHSLRSRSARNR